MRKAKLFIALALFTGTAIADSGPQWLAAGESDLVATRLTSDISAIPASHHAESAAITFAWPATAERMEQQTAPAIQAESRQYWIDATGSVLNRGLKLPLTAPGAVIRISALESGSELRLDPARMELAIDDQPLDRATVQDLVTGAQMRDQGMMVPEDSLAFRLPADVDARMLDVRLSGAPADQALVVHVFEPNSEWTANLTAPRSNFLAGQPIDLAVRLSNGKQEFTINDVQALMVDPSASRSFTMSRVDNGMGLSGEVPVNAIAAAPGLYEAHVYVNHNIGGTIIKRDLKLAFGIAPAAGRFNGEVSRMAGDDFALSLGVEVAAAGRYQVNGEIYGTNQFGHLQPLAFAQSAAVLNAGQGQIALKVEADTLATAGLSAPFEVRNLQLLDQGRMYLLEERQRAVLIDAVDQRRGPGHLIER